MNVALLRTRRDLENQGQGTFHEKIGDFLLVDATHRHNSNDYPNISTTTDMNMTTSMSPDVIDYGFKMVTTKPELEIAFER